MTCTAIVKYIFVSPLLSCLRFVDRLHANGLSLYFFWTI